VEGERERRERLLVALQYTARPNAVGIKGESSFRWTISGGPP